MITYSTLHPKQYSQGSTLIEVMVSVLILTFGILLLMAAQIRTVASVSEAANRSVIAQAAEDLAEGMQINPTLAKEDGNSVIKRRYPAYHKARTVASASTSTPTLSGSGLQKDSVANIQLENFSNILATQVLNASEIAYTICRDRAQFTEPDANGMNCTPQNTADDVTVIKVVWTMEGKNGTNTNDPNSTLYTYTLQVAD